MNNKQNNKKSMFQRIFKFLKIALGFDFGGRRKIIGEVDSSSPMEPKVLRWIQKTHFWKYRKDDITLFCNYPIWQYMNKPLKKYRTDFCIIFNEVKIVIEYDGWVHFRNKKVNKNNWKTSYSIKDKKREGYITKAGYQVIRLNKFNIDPNPVSYINGRIRQEIKQINKNIIMANRRK